MSLEMIRKRLALNSLLQSLASFLAQALHVCRVTTRTHGSSIVWRKLLLLNLNLGGVGTTFLMKFNRSTATWSTVNQWNIATGGLGTLWDASYASNGYIYSTEVYTGQIYRFAINGCSYTKISTTRGPLLGLLPAQNDGARCANAARI